MTNALLDRQKTRGILGSRVAKERVDGPIESWEPADFAEPRLDERRQIYGIPGSKVSGNPVGGVLEPWKPSDLVEPGVEGETFVQIEPTFDDGADSVPAKMAVKDLNLWYKDFHALKDINLEFPVNQVTALIGPSGCGKSTLLKTLNRMNDLVEGCRVEGEVTLDGQDTYRSIGVNDLRRRVGMVFQQPNPFPMSVYDNIAFGPRTHGIKNRKQLDEIVEQSLRDAAIWDELKDRLKKNALGLSGGQQQRLCIARALAVRPEVLLMDESTSALDPISTAKIEELVGQLKSKYTVIMVTHNMLQALRVSDQTAFFLLGEMVETGPTDDIFTNPRDHRTADYVAGRFG